MAHSGCRDREGSALPTAGTAAAISAEPRPSTPASAGPIASAPSPPASTAPVAAPRGAGLLRRPWLTLSRADLEQAVQQAGYQLGQYSESNADNGRLLRIVKVTKGTFQGSVCWYKTDDLEGAQRTLVAGAPHRVEGGVLLVVKTADPAARAEAEALLSLLAGP
jgi:hypothetical protein